MQGRFLLSFHLFCRQTDSFLCLCVCVCAWVCVCRCVCLDVCVFSPLFSSICQGVYWSLPRPLLYSYKWAPLPSNQHWWLEMNNLTAHHRKLCIGWGRLEGEKVGFFGLLHLRIVKNWFPQREEVEFSWCFPLEHLQSSPGLLTG